MVKTHSVLTESTHFSGFGAHTVLAELGGSTLVDCLYSTMLFNKEF